MNLRPYQDDAKQRAIDEFRENNSTLVVMATGLGKTVLFSSVVDHFTKTIGGRALVMAHREELITQAADKIERVIGDKPEIEMAEQWADTHMFRRARCVVSSVQTLNAGNNGDGRMARFRPEDFGLLVIDEAHHATAKTYRKIIDHFRTNKELKVLGVTATPDRTDEEALGQVFDSVAYVYELGDAVRDGWLVKPEQQSVIVEGLDLSAVRTTAGDLNGKDLANLMEDEEALHKIATPTLELAGERKSLVFAASVKHAERLAEIFNRHKEGCARWVHGGTPKDERRQMFRDYAERRFQFLVNVGVATEGFDDPGIECVTIARPTKSRALYAQMVGRGTRPLPGIVDGITGNDGGEGMITAAGLRKESIRQSGKPNVLVLDFEGQAGRHKLICTADILGGKYSDEAVEAAKKATAQSGGPVDVMAALDEAERELTEKRKKEAEAARKAITVSAAYKIRSVDPFDVFNIEAPRERGWDKVKHPSARMVEVLTKHGIKTDGKSFAECKALIAQVIERSKSGLCTYRQAAKLRQYGVNTDGLTFDQASTQLNKIAENGGRMPYVRRPAAA